MANLFEFWLNLLVTPTHLNAVQDNLQAADRAMMVDAAFGGVFYGLAVTERGGGANLTVDVSAGAAYDVDGARVRTPSTQNVPVDEDYDGTPTAVAGVGNERWLSISIRFIRAESVPYVDGNSNPGNFVQDESYEFVVKQGAEAGAGLAARPALLADAVLLADVKIVYGTTQVLDADVSTTRRQLPFDLSGTVHTLQAGRVGGSGGALDQLLGWLDGHVSGVSDKHAASAINYAGGGNWADGTTNPATTVEAQLDKMISDLTNAAGSARVASASFSFGVTNITGATVYAQLTQVAQATNLYYAGGGSWADGSTNPATSVEAQLDKNISDLASTSASGGLAKVGCGARTTWLGGRTNPATTSFAALDKVVTDLSAQTAGDDGMERVGGEARAGSPNSLAAGSAASQAAELLGFTNTNAGAISTLDSRASTVWARLTGSSVGAFGNFTLTKQYNVSSAVANAAGYVEVTFTNALADANYAVIASAMDSSHFYDYVGRADTASKCRIYVYNTGTNTLANPTVGIFAFAFDIKG